MMTTRDVMTPDCTCAAVSDTLVEAARVMRDLGVGALPICGLDDMLRGMITDRDIVVGCVAEGTDPSTATVAEFASGRPVTIGADDSIELAARTMTEHGVRRLPVIDGHDLVGIVAQADLVQHLSAQHAGDLVEALSAAPSNN